VLELAIYEVKGLEDLWEVKYQAKRIFTPEELKEFNGKSGNGILYQIPHV
jgi:hypothetical protein